MTLIKSLDDLAQARAEAHQRRSAAQPRFELRVSLGSCGLAAGAQSVFDMFERLLVEIDRADGAQTDRERVRLTRTGCIGLCALEPVVQVLTPDQPPLTYGKVTPEVARRIIVQHIEKGLALQEYLVDQH